MVSGDGTSSWAMRLLMISGNPVVPSDVTNPADTNIVSAGGNTDGALPT